MHEKERRAKSPRWVERIVVFTENNGNLALPPIVVFWWLVVGEWAEEMPPILV